MNPSSIPARTGSLANAFSLALLIVCGMLSIVPEAAAADTKGAGTETGQRFAAVWRIKGDVTASASSGAERRLREGDPVMVGERVHAAPTAEAVLKTDDAGAVGIRPGAEFVAERFAAQGDSSDSFTMRLITGSLRIITGWIGHTNREGSRIVTPTATIGIRGTDHEPYVLVKDLVGTNTYRAGTYDKVNRGGTTLEAAGQTLDIDSGKVGFARSPGSKKERALMTLLLPVLLEKVPDFYVPGEFDGELDSYSQTVDENSLQQLEQKRKGAPPPAPAAAPVAACKTNASGVAKKWLTQLDEAIVKRNAPNIIAMFAPDVAVRAIVIKQDGSTATIDLGREELAQSTLAAIKQLRGYKHRRVSLEANLAVADDAPACQRVNVKSVVIEQGTQAGKRFRFESTEDYVLELRAGKWLAIKAETTQK